MDPPIQKQNSPFNLQIKGSGEEGKHDQGCQDPERGVARERASGGWGAIDDPRRESRRSEVRTLRSDSAFLVSFLFLVSFFF
jgi:hypothetical protein